MLKTVALFAILVWSYLAFSGPVLYNGTAATVGKQIITIRDAQFFRALARFREGISPAIVEEKGDDLRLTVQKIVFEEMVYAELKSFEFDGGPRAAAEKLVAQLRAKRESDWKGILKKFGVSETAVIDRVYKSLQVEKFLQKKIDTLTPIVTDAEVEKYFKHNESKFKGHEFEQMKPNITLILKKQRMQKGLEEWVRFLKDKYGVTNLLEG